MVETGILTAADIFRRQHLEKAPYGFEHKVLSTLKTCQFAHGILLVPHIVVTGRLEKSRSYNGGNMKSEMPPGPGHTPMMQLHDIAMEMAT